MKTTQKLMYVIMIAVIAAFASCKGEMGPAGPAGADGTDGINGTDGQDGNANVTASPWITPTWSATSATYGNFTYSDTAFTADILSTAAVLSYLDWLGDSTNIYTVPFTYGTSNIISYNFNLLLGKIRWFYYAQSAIIPPVNMRLRYVIIPSTTANKSANPQQEILYNLDRAGVDVNNYYQVMDYYGLEY